MKPLKPLSIKKTGKQERERKVLLGLIEYYLKTGRPVGSNTLKEEGFEDLSSATIRNYFAKLEEEGYLSQQHSSGGRIPTHKAYRFYAESSKEHPIANKQNEKEFQLLSNIETRELAAYLQASAEKLSNLTQCAVFLSAPQFDQDFITGLKVVNIDHSRCLCIIITDFGLIKTEILQTTKKLSAHAIKRIEAYFNWRLTGLDKPEHMEEDEEQLAQKFYNELMVRYIVSYSHFKDADLYRTGFSRLLAYPEFHDVESMTNALSLFENAQSMRLLLRECSSMNTLKIWIGDDLQFYTSGVADCSVIASPFYVNHQPAGAVGILGPARLNYREMYGTIQQFSQSVSQALTKSVFKFKISFRQPEGSQTKLNEKQQFLLGPQNLILLENKRNNV